MSNNFLQWRVEKKKILQLENSRWTDTPCPNTPHTAPTVLSHTAYSHQTCQITHTHTQTENKTSKHEAYKYEGNKNHKERPSPVCKTLFSIQLSTDQKQTDNDVSAKHVTISPYTGARAAQYATPEHSRDNKPEPFILFSLSTPSHSYPKKTGQKKCKNKESWRRQKKRQLSIMKRR